MNKSKKILTAILICTLILVAFFVTKLYFAGKPINEPCKCDCKEKTEQKFSQNCVSSKLGGVIANLENEIHYIDARELTNGKVENWTIVKNKVGAYAIIKSNDGTAIENLKDYFKRMDINYQFKNIIDDWYVYISGAENYNFNELEECIKY